MGGQTVARRSARYRPPYGAGLLWLLVAAGLGACGSPSAPPAAGVVPTLTVATAIPPTGVRTFVDTLTLETPILIGWDGRPVARVLDSPVWSADGLTLRLHLNAGITFHDGTPLTNTLAADILRAALSPRNGIVSTTVYEVLPEGQDAIVIRTRQPEGFLLSDISAASFALPGKPGVGTGPFVLDPGSKPSTLRAFAGYRQGRPAIEKITITEFDTQRQAYTAMMQGKADVLYDVSSESLDFVEAESALTTHSFMRAYYHALAFNLRLPVFARPGVRRALNDAVDRRQIVELGLHTRGQPADGPVWPYHFAHLVDERAMAHDPANARRLLDAAGLTMGSRNVAGQMPSRFRFTCLVPVEDLRLQRVALLVQKHLFNIGVDMEVELGLFAAITKRVGGGDFEAAILQMSATRSLSYVYTFWHSPNPGGAGVLNLPYAAADGPLDRLRRAIGERDVRAAVRDVQQALYDDPPAIFLDWQETTRAVTANVEIKAEAGRDVFRNIHEWKLAPAAAARR